FIIVTVTSWTSIAETGGKLTGSPFVKGFNENGIPFAGGIIKFLVISAALSRVNTNLYLFSRRIFSLSRAGYIPDALGSVDSRGVPVAALSASGAGMIAAIILALKGQQGFLLLYGTAVAAMFFVWTTILVTHLRFRSALSLERIRALPIRMPVHGI